ncbi:MAG: hypothetical protein PW788_05075 [Micavibrio sp.]|nr:hypothetical protein [Micavibrio sp.]
MDNARVSATIAQVKGIEAATTTFRDSYNAFPGDMPSASTRVPSCNANCSLPAASTTAGDGIIGGTAAWAANYNPQLTAAMAQPPTTAAEETQLFWTELLLANLTSGYTDSPIRTTPPVPSWGNTMPSAKLGGGFVVGYATGLNGPGSTNATAAQGPSGTVLVMTNSPTAVLATTTGNLPLTPSRAAQIDRKLDDGKPATGFVQAYGVAASCFQAATVLAYQEALTAKDCGLILRIQG